MRDARFRDYARRLVEKREDWPLRLTRFAFENVQSLGQDEFAFDTALTILCGPNGVGKTTLLRAIWATAAPDSYRSTPGTDLKLGSGKGTLDYIWEKDRQSVEHVFGADAKESQFPVPVIHIDASSQPTKLQNEFCEIGDFEEITNGIGALELDAKQLQEVRSLCARDYRSVTVYEVEIGEDVAPFFELAYGDDRYDSRTMGSGEAAALFLWWSLERVEARSLVLVEEPETFLSPSSQEAFIRYLCGKLFNKKIVAIVTSHSAKIIQSVGDIHHAFIHRFKGKIKIDTGGASPDFLKLIGIEPSVAAVLLVEDEAALEFLRRILKRCKPELSRKCEIVNMRGHGDISTLLRKTKDRLATVQFIGVYDGDQRGEVDEDLTPLAAFLPGGEPVEMTFRGMVENDVEAAKKAFGEDRLSEILSALEGKDHHDWFEDLAKSLELRKDQLFLQLYQMWERLGGSPEASLACVAEIETCLFPLSLEQEESTSAEADVSDDQSQAFSEAGVAKKSRSPAPSTRGTEK